MKNIFYNLSSRINRILSLYLIVYARYIVKLIAFSTTISQKIGHIHKISSKLMLHSQYDTDLNRLMTKKIDNKIITFIRHGCTEMNELMAPWGSKNFVDLNLWDTKLSKKGIKQCKLLNEKLHKVTDREKSLELYNILESELVVISPLQRALQTTELILADINLKNCESKIVLPAAAERLYLSSDVGKSRSDLENSFSGYNWNFSQVSECPWWYIPSRYDEEYVEWRPTGTYGVPGEPEHRFRQRMCELKSWLLKQPQNRITVISHWGVIRALTAADFNNCEIRSFEFNSLLDNFIVDS